MFHRVWMFDTHLSKSEKKSVDQNGTVRLYRMLVDTLSPIIMEVDNYPKWKETNIGDTAIFHFHDYGRKGNSSRKIDWISEVDRWSSQTGPKHMSDEKHQMTRQFTGNSRFTVGTYNLPFYRLQSIFWGLKAFVFLWFWGPKVLSYIIVYICTQTGSLAPLDPIKNTTTTTTTTTKKKKHRETVDNFLAHSIFKSWMFLDFPPTLRLKKPLSVSYRLGGWLVLELPHLMNDHVWIWWFSGSVAVCFLNFLLWDSSPWILFLGEFLQIRSHGISPLNHHLGNTFVYLLFFPSILS